jgi:hypothetical protein
MAAGGIIAEFLASVGFKTDEKSLKSSLLKVAAFGAAVQAIAVGVYAGITKIADSEANLARQAERLGTTSDRLREMGYIAEQNGSSLDAVNKSMEALVSKNPRIRDAAKALETAGQRMKGMSEAARKVYAARMGIDPSLIPALINDTRALSAEFKAMYAIAGIDSKRAAEDTKGFMAEIGKLKTLVDLLMRAVALAFIGRIRKDGESLRRSIMENFDKIKKVLEAVISVVLRIASVISAFIYRVIKTISAVVKWFDNLSASNKKVVIGLGLFLAAWKLLNLEFLKTPLGVILAGLAGLLLLIDDYMTYMEGGRSYFDWGPWEKTIESIRQKLPDMLNTILAIGKAVSAGEKAISLFGKASKIIPGLIGNITKAVRLLGLAVAANPIGAALFIIITLAMLVYEYWDEIVGFFKWVWGQITDAFPNFAAWAEDVYNSIVAWIGKAVDWVKDKFSKLLDYLPDFVKEALGIKVEAAAPEATAAAMEQMNAALLAAQGPVQAAAAIDTEALSRAAAQAQATQAPALVPGQAQAAAMDNRTTNDVKLNARTEIIVNGAGDPEAVGAAVANRQGQVNADMQRNLQGNMR